MIFYAAPLANDHPHNNASPEWHSGRKTYRRSSASTVGGAHRDEARGVANSTKKPSWVPNHACGMVSFLSLAEWQRRLPRARVRTQRLLPNSALKELEFGVPSFGAPNTEMWGGSTEGGAVTPKVAMLRKRLMASGAGVNNYA